MRFDGVDTPVDSKISNSDTIFKVNLTWNTSDNTMVYFTWSEGYRPGGINRDPGLPASALTWIPDVLTNIELGWKTTSADGRIRFNGAIYTMDWDDIQYTVYDPQLSFCCGSTYNLSTAQITGFEAEVVRDGDEEVSLPEYMCHANLGFARMDEHREPRLAS